MIEIVGDPLARKLSVSGETVHLTEREAELFQVLSAHPGEFLSRHELERAIWGTDQYISPVTLMTLVQRLRRKIGSEHVLRSRGYGYMYNP